MNNKKGQSRRRRASAPGIMSPAMAKVYEVNRNEESRLVFDIDKLGRKHHLNSIRHYTEVKAIAKELANLEIERDNLSITFSKKELKEKDVPLLARKKMTFKRPNSKVRLSGKKQLQGQVGEFKAGSNQTLARSMSSDLFKTTELTETGIAKSPDNERFPPICDSKVNPRQRQRSIVQRRHSAFPRMVSDSKKVAEIPTNTLTGQRRLATPDTESGVLTGPSNVLSISPTTKKVGSSHEIKDESGDVTEEFGQKTNAFQSPKRTRHTKSEIELHEKHLQTKINNFLHSHLPGEKENL